MRRLIGLLLPAALLVAFSPAVASAAANIGVTSAVRPQATSTAPQAEPRVLEVGTDVVANERIVTGAEGKTHLLFRDGSALTIGANAEVVLDEFVYDPIGKTGTIALSATKGVLRFVGGRISKTNPVQIRTPTATIGIRGGIAIVGIGGDQVSAKFLFGQQLTVDANGEVVTVDRPGFQVTVPNGGVPTAPQPIPAGELVGDVADLEGGPGEPTGGPGAISDNDVSGSQLGNLGSNNVPGQLGPPPPAPPPPPTNVANGGIATEIVEAQNQTIATNMLSALIGSSVSTTAGVAVLPFFDFGFQDGVPGGVITLTISLADIASGSFTLESLQAGGFVDQGGGVFVFTGTGDQALAALRQLVFVPASNLVGTGQSRNVAFVLQAFDGSTSTSFIQSVLVSCATQCISGLGGRAKAGTDTAQGTTGANVAFSGGALVTGQKFVVNTSAGMFSLPVPSSTGEFSVSGATVPASFGSSPVSGTGFLAPNTDFLLYELTGSQILIFAGLPASSFSPGTSFQAATYSLRDDFTLDGSEIPFVPKAFQTSIANHIDPKLTLLLGTQSGGDQFFFAGNVLIDGTGASQGRAGSLLVGRAQNSGPGTMFLVGSARGIADNGASGAVPNRFLGPVTTADDVGGFDFFGSDGPRYAVLDSANVSSTDADLGGGGIVRQQGNAQIGSTIFPNVPALNQQAGLGIFTPAAGPANNQRTSRTLKGYAGGVALERDASNTLIDVSTFRSNTNPSPNVFDRLQVTTDASTNRISVTMNLVSDRDGFSAGFDTTTIVGFGGMGDAGRSAFLNNGTFAAIEQSGAVTVNNNSGTMGGFLVTGNQITFAGGALSGVTLCTCADLQWGVFSATLVDPGNATYEVPLAQWVAGVPAAMGQVAGFNGIATYTGHAIASVVNGLNSSVGSVERYTAVGSFSIDLVFSSGTLDINGGGMVLDGHSYSIVSPGSQNLSPPEFSFNLNGGIPRSGEGIGSLYGGGTPPNQAGGHFSVADGGTSSDPTTYQASGIFAADLTNTQIPQ